MDRTIFARLHYDGTRFAGWQIQPDARTVQGEIEAVLLRLLDHPVRVHAAGRTDAGVHALGMAVSAIVPARWTPDALRRSVNALLPPDCWVSEVREARRGFHARYAATGRRYAYRVGADADAKSPFRRPFEWALEPAPAREVLDRMATILLGTHDFRALAVQTGELENCRCTIRQAQWVPRIQDRGVEFHVAADRYLQHMVRILVATKVDAALGRRPESDLASLLGQVPGVRASAPAPPHGLYFVRAEYPDHWFRLDEDPG
jgi:tRNA pseudouridine38-40 synthase